MNEVTAYDFNGYTKSIASLFGKTPKLSIICGNCRCLFKKRFEIRELHVGHPRTMCPHCQTVNVVPIELA